MDQQPKIPTLKDAQKPQVKIKGLGAGLTLFDRLKQFKKKDLAFILAGLGTLFMAPLAEHFMMAPENGDGQLQQGWGKGGGTGGNFFGSGSSPYENGNNSIAQGGPNGGGGDIITPLNVRDPSALVMGPGQSQQPPAGSIAPSTPPPAAPRGESDYKDALAGAASRAASAAVKRSPLPVPKVALGGSGLRGLGVAGGGSSASGSLGPINGGAGGTAGTGGGGLNLVRAMPNFRGAAGARGPNSPSNLDGTKRAGANAGDAFSRTGSALSGLNAAASEQIPTGGGGFGGGGQGGAGANDKPYGGNGPGGSKSVGESLAFIEAKERMMENLKLEFEKRKLKDPELLLYGIRNDMLKKLAEKVGEGLGTQLAKLTDPDTYKADPTAGTTIDCPDGYSGPLSSGPKCEGKAADQGRSGCLSYDKGTSKWYWNVPGSPRVECTTKGPDGDANPPKAENPPSTPGGAATNPDGSPNTGDPKPGVIAKSAALDTLCTSLKEVIAAFNGPAEPGVTASGTVGTAAAYEDMLPMAKNLLQARSSLVGGANGGCDIENETMDDVAKYHENVAAYLDGQPVPQAVMANLLNAVAKTPKDGEADLKKAVDRNGLVNSDLKDAQKQYVTGNNALVGLEGKTFEMPESDKKNQTLGALKAAFDEANTKKGQLSEYVKKAEERQAVLQKAHDDTLTSANGPARSIQTINEEFETLKSVKSGVTDPDEGLAKGAVAPAKTQQEVGDATLKARNAIQTACGGKPCQTPASTEPKPTGDASEETKLAVAAVKEMRDAQRGFLGAISNTIHPREAAPTETPAETPVEPAPATGGGPEFTPP